MCQPPLTRAYDPTPIDAASSTLTYDWESDAYRLRIAVRRHGRGDWTVQTYDALTIEEAADVLAATLIALA